ncbi:MAG TPA: DUF502 domain-containing protein [Chlamydiales bacterium]|nr:DUF502 domain-containing protein [Chlamydiales bacterium]
MKRSFITGLIITLPVVFTVLVVLFLLDFLTSPFIDLTTDIIKRFTMLDDLLVKAPEAITFISRIFILMILAGFIFVLGFTARWLFFKTLVNWANAILSKIPVVKTIFKLIKDIIGAVITDKKDRKAFKESRMVPFPHEKSHAIGFLSGDVPQECMEKSGKKLVSVFVPTAPHPISGYLLMLPEEKAQKIQMSNEETIKFTVSCGMITSLEKTEMNPSN